MKHHDKMKTFALTFFGKIEDSDGLIKSLADKLTEWDISWNSERFNSIKMTRSGATDDIDEPEQEQEQEQSEESKENKESKNNQNKETEIEHAETSNANTTSPLFSINISTIIFTLLFAFFKYNRLLI